MITVVSSCWAPLSISFVTSYQLFLFVYCVIIKIARAEAPLAKNYVKRNKNDKKTFGSE